mgnify:CR=1 FL=1
MRVAAANLTAHGVTMDFTTSLTDPQIRAWERRGGGGQRVGRQRRRGVGVALGHPIYVVEKNPETNTVTIGAKSDLMCDSVEAAVLSIAVNVNLNALG